MGVISQSVINVMRDNIKESLRGTAVATLSAYNQNTGDYIESGNGDIWKGSYNISKSDLLVDTIKENSNMEVTFFYGSKRIMTSVIDKNGKRVLGTPAGDVIIENVLKKGQEYFSERVSIDGEIYYGYYIPVFEKNDKNQAIGMIFVGTNKEAKDIVENKMIGSILAVILIVITIFVLIALIAASSITKPIKISIDTIKQVASGNLNVNIDEKMLKRSDEIGDMLHSISKLKEDLKVIIKGISDNTNVLLNSVNKLNETAQCTTKTVDNMGKAVESIAAGASSQAEGVQKTSENIMKMGNIISESAEDVNNLNKTANIMKESSNIASKSLIELDYVNEEVKSAIDSIYEQTNKTNISTQKIKDVVALISSISDDTNLLALNASIEAARAGDAGKGFAVVASEVQKLAEQSNESSKSIYNIVNQLITESNESVKTMNEVKEIVGNQNKNVSATKENVEQLMDGIDKSLEKIKKIDKGTKELDIERMSMINLVQDLSVSSEENAAATQETLAGTTEVIEVFDDVTKLASEVKSVTDSIVEKIRVFEI